MFKDVDGVYHLYYQCRVSPIRSQGFDTNPVNSEPNGRRGWIPALGSRYFKGSLHVGESANCSVSIHFRGNHFLGVMRDRPKQHFGLLSEPNKWCCRNLHFEYPQ